LTTPGSTHPDAVSGLNILRECLWPQVLTMLDQNLSTVFNSNNAYQFHTNYLTAKDFIKFLREVYFPGSEEQDSYFLDGLIDMFNLQTYFNVVTVEITSQFQSEIDKIYDQANNSEGSKSMSSVTIGYIGKVLSQLYLPELGDKMIKLAIQFAIRHLNWVMDKINEKKTMSTERLLLILEDLSRL
jgi:hypothetical protein